MSKGILKMLAICGIVAVLWFNLLVLICGALVPEYSHVYDFMSTLGAAGAPTAWVFNPLGFGLYGVLMILFSIGLYFGGAGRIGSLLLIVSSIGFFVAGMFPIGPETLAMHMVGFFIIVGGFILSVFFFAESMRRSDVWKDLWKYTLITAVAYTLYFIAHQNRVFGDVVGLSQRIMSWIAWLWILVVAYKLYRLNS